MIEGLKPYGKYKKSGQEWLGDVPEHWDVRRTKLILRELDARSTTGKEQLLRVSQYTGVTQRKSSDGSESPDTRAASLVGYKQVSVNDLVINIMLAWNGSLGVSRYEGIASPAYCVYRFNNNLLPWYFHQMLRLPLYKGRIKAASTGVVESRLRLYSDALGCIEALIPPSQEQIAIVQFLDYVNRKIDSFILAKRNELTLISEMLMTVTQQAMALADARNIRLSAAAEVISRPIDRHVTKNYTRLGLYNRGRGIFHKPVTSSAELGASDFFWVEEGDLVISGQFAWEGAVALARSKDSGCVVSHRYPILRGRKDIVSSSVLLAILRTKYGALLLDHHSRGAAGRNRPLNANAFFKEKLFIPPVSAQARIVELLDREYSISQSVANSIRLLNEYRTRLTSDIVTGRLDVRGATAILQEVADDPIDLSDEVDFTDEEIDA